MRKYIVPVAFAMVAGAVWLATIKEQSIPAGLPAAKVAVQPPVALPLPPAPKLEPALPRETPTLSAGSASREDLYKTAEVLFIRELPPVPGSRQKRRERLLRLVGEKYPLVRVEETVELVPNPSTGVEEEVTRNRIAMVADHAMVALPEGLDEAKVAEVAAAYGLKVRSKLRGGGGIYLMEIPVVTLDSLPLSVKKLTEAMAAAQPAVAGAPILAAEPDYLVHVTAEAQRLPNDTKFRELWGMHNTGQTGGAWDADIDAPTAWALSTGSLAVKVAVIDTGVDITHPDLAGNIWTNPGEIPGNGVDDDKNGYVDDHRGWNFVNDTPNAGDDHYHGTHCAGTVGALGNNGLGVVGVAWQVSIVPLKFLSASGSGLTSDSIAAIRYATAMGCHITSNSWGGGGYSALLRQAIEAGGAAGVVCVAAAGNDSRDNDVSPAYPASYDLDAIISVASSDPSDVLSTFSNFGKTSVDLTAPGSAIVSTAPGGGYRSLNGTSMATPMVSGALALLKALNPTLTVAQQKAKLLQSVDKKAAFYNVVAAGGRLNVGNLVRSAAGPILQSRSAKWSDALADGANGNGDGIMNPDEAVTLAVVVENVGSNSASNIEATLSLPAGTPNVSITQSTVTFPTTAAGEFSAGRSPFRVQIAPTATTPQTLAAQLTFRSGALVWTETVELPIFRTVTLAGRVTAKRNSAAISGATVSWTGPRGGSVTTAADGTYSVNLIDGTYGVSASASGYLPSAATAVSMPPSAANINFSLGQASLAVLPASLDVPVNPNQTAQRTLTLTNSGDSPLSYSVVGSYTLSSFTRAASAEPDGAADGLPFFEDFEAATLAGWNLTGSSSAVAELTTATAVSGLKSLRLKAPASSWSQNGVTRVLPREARPKTLRFSVRAGSASKDHATFTFSDDLGGTLIDFRAGALGVFRINTLYGGGDASYAYEPNRWYDVELRNLDWTARTFDVAIDGFTVRSAMPFLSNYGNNSQFAGRLTLSNYDADSESWWDNVVASDGNVNWLRAAPATGVVPAGGSATVTVTLNAAGLTAADYSGALTFTSNATSQPQVRVPVTLRVTSLPNTAPVASATTVTILEDAAANVTLGGTDAEGNVLQATITSLPAKGSLYQVFSNGSPGSQVSAVPAVVVHPGGQVRFIPPANEFGAPYATFQFTVSDGLKSSAPAAAQINVTAVNDPPVARHDLAVNAVPAVLTIPVLANDTDADGTTPTIQSTTQGGRGATTVVGGSIRYTPNPAFTNGFDVFTYTITDGAGSTATASVTVRFGLSGGGDWTTFGGAQEHTGYTQAVLGSQPLVKAWETTKTTGAMQPTVVAGRVYVTVTGLQPEWASTWNTLALDAPSGAEIWRRGWPNASSVNQPTHHNGRLYLQRGNHGSDTQLWALNALDGSAVWSAPFGAQWQSYEAPAVNNAGIWINGGSYGGLYGFSHAGAQLFFNSSLAQYDRWTPTLGADGTVYSYVAGLLKAHSPTTGAVNWSLDLGWSWSGWSMYTVTVRSGSTLVAAGTAGLHAVNLATRAKLWTAPGAFVGSPAIAAGVVYAFQGDSLKKYDLATGTPLGSITTPDGSSASQPLVTDDSIIVPGNNSTGIYDLTGTTPRQTIPAGGRLALADGMLYIAGAKLQAWQMVGSSNPAPVATATSATLTEDTSVMVTLTGSDAQNEPVYPVLSRMPLKGSLFQVNGTNRGARISTAPALILDPQGRVIYEPDADGFGANYDTIGFKVSDARQLSAEATATLNVTGVNDAPVAVDDVAGTRANEPLESLRPLLNDMDADGDALAVQSFTQPTRGALEQTAPGVFRYTPGSSFAGTGDSFTYVAVDAAGVTATATVRIVAGAAGGTEWQMLGNTPDHAGYVPASVGSALWVAQWRRQPVMGAPGTQPAIGGGLVTMSFPARFGENTVVALDGASGAELWRALPGTVSSLSPVSYGGGRVYFQHGKGTSNPPSAALQALNAADGSPVWSKPIASQWESYTAPTFADGAAWVNGGAYGGIYGVALGDGSEKFFRQLSQVDNWAPAYDGSRLYVAHADSFECVDPVTGILRWQFTIPGIGTPQVVVGNGRAYFQAPVKISDNISSPGLYCVNLANQAVAWKSVGAEGMPALAQGVVYAVSAQSLKAHQGSTGTVLLTIPAPTGHTFVHRQPIVTNDAIFASAVANTSEDRTLVFERHTGALLQTLPDGGQMSFGGDRLVIASSSSNYQIISYGRAKPGNSLPVPLAETITIPEDAALPLKLEGADAEGDPVRAIIMTLPASGKLYQTTSSGARAGQIVRVPTQVLQQENTVIYEPEPDGNGPGYGNFTFALVDGYGFSGPATIAINVTPVNDAPVAADDYFTLSPGAGLDLQLLANDRDVDGDTLEITAIANAASGQAQLISPTMVRYQAANSAGADTFTYTVRDPAGVSTTATVRVLVNATAGMDWAMLGNDAAHTGYTPINAGPAVWQAAWNVTAPTNTNPSSVAVEDGTVAVSMASYYGTNLVLGLSAVSGAEIWRKDMGAVGRLMPPAVKNGHVFVQNGSGTGTSNTAQMSRFSLATGAVSFQRPWNTQFSSYLAPVVADGKLWFGGGTYGGLYAFNETTGAQIFFQNGTQTDGWTPTYDGASIYTCLYGVLRSLNATTGAERWTLTLNSGAYSSQHPVVSGAFLAVSLGSEIVVVNTTTQNVVWRKTGSFEPHVSVAHGELCAPLNTGSVEALDVATGTLRRTYTASVSSTGRKPVITNDTVVIGTGTTTEVFDRWSTNRRQVIPLAGELAMAGGRLFISTANAIHCYGRPAVNNLPPVALAGLTQLDEDQTAVITLAGSDPNGDPIRATVASLPTRGSLFQTTDGVAKGSRITVVPAVVLNAGRKVIYDPGADQNGAGMGTFTWYLSDTFTNSTTMTQIVDVAPLPDAPVASADLAATQPGQLISPLSVLLNDTDADGGVLMISSFTQPTNGLVTLTPAGELSYLPNAGFTGGVDTFSYTISDPTGRFSTAQVSINVSPTAGQDWPTFGGGPAHTGYVPLSLGTGAWALEWSASIDSAVATQPAIQDGVVCLSSASTGSINSGISVRGLSTATGAQLWQRPLPAGSINPPSLHNGKAYVQRGNHGTDTQLIALNASTGAILWQAPHGAQWESYYAPAVTDTGIWINGGNYGGMYGFSPAGSQLAFVNMAQYDDWTPTIGPDGTVYSWVAGLFSAHHPTNGVTQWSTQLGWDWRGWSMNTVSAVAHGRAFVIGSPGLHAVSLSTQQALWSRPEAFTGSPATAGGAVFAIQGDTVRSFNVATGAPLLSYTAPGASLLHQPIVTNDLVLAASSTQTFVFERQSANLVQTLTGGAPIALAGKSLLAWNGASQLRLYSAPWSVRFSPAGGAFAQPVDVTVTAADSAATIYYSLDGSAPEFSKRTVPSGGIIRIETTGPLLAVAVSTNGRVSPVAGAQFTFTDADADGIPDWWELARFGNLAGTNGSDDTDGDGLSTKTEFLVGTNPQDGASKLITPTITWGPAHCLLSWPSVNGRAYVVQCSDRLSNWAPVSNEIRGTGGLLTFIHPRPDASAAPQRFYRVQAAY